MDRSQASKKSRGRILVVDDDPLLREFLVHFLQEAGFEVRPAPDGLTALSFFSTEHFDLIFTDYRMPGMTGLEVATAVRKTNPIIPIIFVTGEVAVPEPKALVQAGISRMLPKPFTLDDVRSCLDLTRAFIPHRRVA